MSRKNLSKGQNHARRNRHPRPSSNADRPARSEDEQALATLPYRKGHLTDQERLLFGELRGALSPGEHHQLDRVAETLHRPVKRLRALDLMRYWGAPLTHNQCRMLPWYAGLAWQRPLPSDRALQPVALARHLLCSQDVPEFLLEPFAHPERYYPAMHWELCRVLATVASGGGLNELREQENFWTWVPADVFERFLETPPDVPIFEGLIDAFVTLWEGPDWLAKQAYTWTHFNSIYFDWPPVLRVAHGLCIAPLPPQQAREAARTRLAAVPEISRLFGHSRKLSIPDIMPPELEGWHSHELRTPNDFEAEHERAGRRVSSRFQEAQLGLVSIWSLRRNDQSITVQVDVSRMRARQLTLYPRHPDLEEERRVLELWALANGLVV